MELNIEMSLESEIKQLEQMIAEYNRISVLVNELKEKIQMQRGRISILEEMKALPSEGDANEE